MTASIRWIATLQLTQWTCCRHLSWVDWHRELATLINKITVVIFHDLYFRGDPCAQQLVAWTDGHILCSAHLKIAQHKLSC